MAKRRKWNGQRLRALTDERLLDLRMSDLGVSIEGTVLEHRIAQLYDELATRGITFRPHCWLSDDWFSPDGVPGIAIPFYLADKRLTQLERTQLLEVEGGTHYWCMKILRHEAGHAIDTAYRLRRRRKYRETFGPVSQPYPAYYEPKPYSRKYVQHLDTWYAQAHPVEDFAETFAVWLRPRSAWRARYKGWPALKKLDYVNEVMQEIGDRKPLVNGRKQVEPLSTIRTSLRDHYQKKRDHYGLNHSNYYDNDLRRLFEESSRDRSRPTAAAFLNRHRREFRRMVAAGTGEYQYTIDQVLTEMIVRCRELKLRLRTSEDEAKREALVMLTVQTMNYLHQGHHRVAM